MGWEKEGGSSDKVVQVIGNNAVSLIGRVSLDSNLLGSSDMIKTLAGDTLINFNVNSDKNVSLSGNTGVILSGSTTYSALLGEMLSVVRLRGESPYSLFPIYCDSTYVTVDFTDITCDNA